MKKIKAANILNLRSSNFATKIPWASGGNHGESISVDSKPNRQVLVEESLKYFPTKILCVFGPAPSILQISINIRQGSQD